MHDVVFSPLPCTECDKGFYGEDCAEVCQCRNGGECRPVTGVCNCTAPWTGPTCQTSKLRSDLVAVHDL